MVIRGGCRCRNWWEVWEEAESGFNIFFCANVGIYVCYTLGGK
jgi:hypothetical protein